MQSVGELDSRVGLDVHTRMVEVGIAEHHVEHLELQIVQVVLAAGGRLHAGLLATADSFQRLVQPFQNAQFYLHIAHQTKYII